MFAKLDFIADDYDVDELNEDDPLGDGTSDRILASALRDYKLGLRA